MKPGGMNGADFQFSGGQRFEISDEGRDGQSPVDDMILEDI